VVDFAELLLRSYELLQRNEPLRRHYQERFRHILVDEFQDTNRLQYAWLKLLGRAAAAPRGAGACLCGRRRRPVDLRLPRRRGRQHARPRARVRVQNVIRLEQNYRSHGNILDAANALIKNNRGRLGKNLWTDAGAGEPIRVFEAYSDSTRRASSSRRSANSCATAPAHPDRLLYRSNAQSRVLEHQLFTPACRIACMAACASSSGRRSSMRWPTCA
jgi:DNA helicase-2/ATP-dependent DNA helicase PcrA